MIDFDFAWNTTLMFIIITAIGAVSWSIFIARHWRRPYTYKIVVFIMMMMIAMLNELYDYAPWFDIFDAHSIWHGSTIPLGFLFWSFVYDDVQFERRLYEEKHKIE